MTGGDTAPCRMTGVTLHGVVSLEVMTDMEQRREERNKLPELYVGGGGLLRTPHRNPCTYLLRWEYMVAILASIRNKRTFISTCPYLSGTGTPGPYTYVARVLGIHGGHIGFDPK